MNAQPAEPSAGNLSAGLIEYLRTALPAPEAVYSEEPTRFASGVETRVYSLRLSGAPEAFAGPLVLRVFDTSTIEERPRLEAAVQNAVVAMGFPAPPVLHVCGDPAPLGGPFIIMERLPGGVMLGSLTRPGTDIIDLVRLLPSLLARMPPVIAGLQAKLHALDSLSLKEMLRTDGVDPSLLSLDSHIGRMKARVDRVNLPGFAEGLNWLRARRPAEPTRLSMCHGDLWFGNVLQRGLRVSGVVDWSMDAMLIGDPAYDVGVTSVGLAAGGADVPFPLRPVARGVQLLLSLAFLRAYRARAPVDREVVRYYQLFRCLDFLSWVAQRVVSPELRARDEPSMLDIEGATKGFVSFFRKRTGITLVMPTA